MTRARHAGPVRVLHVMDGLGIGGAEVQLALLLSHLPRQRFTNAICHVGPRADLGPRLQDAGAAVHDLSHNGRRSPVAGMARLLRVAREFHPDLIHTDGLYATLFGRLLGLLLRVPVLTTVGNTLAAASGWRLPTWAGRWHVALSAGNAITARLSGHFLAISDAVRESLVAAYRLSPDRITIVRRGLDLEQIRPAPTPVIDRLRASVDLAGAWPLLLNVGRLTRQKGQEYLIRALPEIRRSLPKVHLLLVGEGPLEARYREIAAEVGGADLVSFLGQRADVNLLLQCADIFVFPSLWEGTGVSLLEAMAWGKPIVATRIPAIVEAVGPAARLVPPRDPAALAEAITRLSRDRDQWPELGRRARRAVEARFDIRTNAPAFGRLLEQVAGVAAGRVESPSADGEGEDRVSGLRRSES